MKQLAIAPILALALSSSGCAHQQLTNRQVAIGAAVVVVVVGLVIVMSKYCDDSNPDSCRFQ